MWLFTIDGFYSVVADRDDEDQLLARARVREDAERLVMAIGAGEVLETPDADYRFRVRLSRQVWSEYAAAAAGGIDYPNFKATVARRHGAARAHAYGRVWAVMLDLQQNSH